MKERNIKSKKGFTLIEIMIAVAIFAIIMVIGISALLNINSVHKVSENERQLMDNLNFMMEDLSRNIRLGHAYHCEQDFHYVVSVGQEPADCGNRSFSLSFVKVEGDDTDPTGAGYILYSIADNGDGWKLYKSDNGGVSVTPFSITPKGITIDPTKSGFIVHGTTNDGIDTIQPTVLISLSGTMDYKGIVTPFSLETEITQRANDITP